MTLGPDLRGYALRDFEPRARRRSCPWGLTAPRTCATLKGDTPRNTDRQTSSPLVRPAPVSGSDRYRTGVPERTLPNPCDGTPGPESLPLLGPDPTPPTCTLWVGERTVEPLGPPKHTGTPPPVTATESEGSRPSWSTSEDPKGLVRPLTGCH